MFALYPYTPCAVYELNITNDAYKKIANTLIAFNKEYNKYKYSFLGTLTSQLGIKRDLKYRYTCSQFVAYLLHMTGEVTLPKHSSLMKPMDFIKIPEAKLIYHGKLKNIDFKSKG